MWAVWLRIPHQNAVKVPLTTRTARQGRCFGQRLFVGNYLGLTGVTTCDKIEALETVTTFGPKLAQVLHRFLWRVGTNGRGSFGC